MRIAKILIVSVLCIAFTAMQVDAQTIDSSGVRARIEALRNAVNRHDAAGAAALWASDAVYTDEDGNRYSGRDAVQKMFAQVFSADPSLKAASLDIENVRFLTKDVANVDGTVRMAGRPTNRYSLTLVRNAGTWMISSGDESPLPLTPTPEPLKNLSWLIGKWHAQSGEASVDMNAEWIGNNNFILCRYEVQRNPQSRAIEGQVIGWDPRTQKPFSWHFDSNGGFGQGVWYRNGKDWTVDMLNTERDGSTFSATNILSAMNPDSFTWQSVNRRRNGSWVDDTQPIKVQRVK